MGESTPVSRRGERKEKLMPSQNMGIKKDGPISGCNSYTGMSNIMKMKMRVERVWFKRFQTGLCISGIHFMSTHIIFGPMFDGAVTPVTGVAIF